MNKKVQAPKFHEDSSSHNSSKSNLDVPEFVGEDTPAPTPIGNQQKGPQKSGEGGRFSQQLQDWLNLKEEQKLSSLAQTSDKQYESDEENKKKKKRHKRKRKRQRNNENIGEAPEERKSFQGSEMTTLEVWLAEKEQSLSDLPETPKLMQQGSFTSEGVAVSVHPELYHEDIDKIKKEFNVPSKTMHIFQQVQLFVQKIVIRKEFEKVVLLLIVASCVMQAIDDPTTDETTLGYEIISYTLTALFAMEMLLKMIAFGLKGYFNNSWNWLDFLVVCEGLYEMAGEGEIKISFLRALRSLRPLRSVKFLPGVAVVVGGMMRSLKALGYVVLVFFLVLLMASLFANLLWQGTFQNQCLQSYYLNESSTAICSLSGSDSDSTTNENQWCSVLSSSGGYECSGDDVCTATGTNPNGFMSFDNVGYAMIVLFQVSTLDSWNAIMVYTQHVMGEYTIVFFMLVILVGSYTLVNLVIATILDDISTAMEEEENKAASELSNVARFWISNTKIETEEGSKDDVLIKVAPASTAESTLDITILKPDGDGSTGLELGWETETAQENGEPVQVLSIEDNAPEEVKEKFDIGDWIVSINGSAIYTLKDIKRAKKHILAGEPMKFKIQRSATPKNILESAPVDCFDGEKIELENASKTQGIVQTIQSCRSKLRDMVNNQTSKFNLFMFFLIAVNSTILAVDGHGVTKEERKFIRGTNFFLNKLFLLEFFFKLAVLGFKDYFRDPYNLFDAFCAVGAVLDAILRGYESGVLVILRAMSIFKLCRIMRFSKTWNRLHEAYSVISASAQNMLPALILLMLCLFIFTILGMELFGTADHGDRIRFDSFSWSFIQIFLIIVGDGWSDQMYQFIETADYTHWASVFFLVLVIIGQYIILNLVLAIVLDGGDDYASKIKLGRLVAKIFRKQVVRSAFNHWLRESRSMPARERKNSHASTILSAESIDITKFREKEHEVDFGRIPTQTMSKRDDFVHTLQVFSEEQQNAQVWAPSKLGEKCKQVLQTKIYFILISGAILASTILLFCEPGGGVTEGNLILAEAALCSIFILELVMKVLANSFRASSEGLLRTPWNLLDIFLVIVSAIHVTLFYAGAASSLSEKVLAVCASFRPMRLGIRSKSFKDMIKSLSASIKGVSSVLILLILAWFIYAVVGVHLFRGLIYSCSDPDFPEGAYRHGKFDANGTWISPPCSGTWVNPATGEEEYRDYEWKRDYFHFDNVFAAMWTLWLFMVLENWTDVLWNVVDGYKIDHQPVTNYNLWRFLYFFIGLMLFGFYLINLSVGVIADTYVRISTENEEHMEMTEEDYMVYEDFEALKRVRPLVLPKVPQNKVSKIFYKIATSPKFEALVTGLLFLVAGVMATYHDGQSDALSEFQSTAEQVFTYLFVVEAADHDTGHYFTSARFLFDFFVTAVCVFDTVFLTYLLDCSGNSSAYISMLRGLRVLRLFRLCLLIEGTKKVLRVAMYPLQTLLCILYIIGISIIVFGQTGVALFSGYHIDEYDMDYQNFEKLQYAIQLLYICSTGEMWVDYKSYMSDAGMNLYVTDIYFLIFIIFQQFLLVNLFVVIVCHTYDILKQQKLEDNKNDFVQLYAQFDPQAKTGLKRHEVFQMLATLGRPLGLGKNASFVALQWRVDLIMHQQDEGNLQRLLLACYGLTIYDPSIEMGNRTCALCLLRAKSVCKIYRFLSTSIRRWREKVVRQ
eukprot:CAMPEP_0117770574 /NCGR_PEP_ID=MMETSP0947-20121206/23904_1 /TAXON_ID=44440 /ORGANISM="Chattonella subsalsa, Strain CCMP2191" /LENGTH=1695 /DNA_ID=CAMNT_0005595677 /DNA_START=234 /DNA_END=5321 /DNA_ORIENTATION=-